MLNFTRKCSFRLSFVLILLSLLTLGNSTLYAAVEKPVNDFKVKGFHIDLRTEIMTMPALKAFAKKLSGIGVNTILMEYEATFPFDKHAVIASRYAYTRAEIKDFVNYCSRLGIDVIPMQQNFGHVEYILRHDRYNHLAENIKDISQVCPLKTAGCVKLFDELFEDMMSLHPSQYFHIGGDETYLLGQCKDCAAKVAKEGKSKLFVDYMKEICNIVIKHGKTPIMWADIIMKYPESISELPKETIFVDWNYGWSLKKFGDVDQLISQGAKFWGAPSIRSNPDNQYVTDWNKHFDNQSFFIPYSRKKGYEGIVMTSWSTSGIYSTIWEVNNEVVDLKPIRYVYPMSGFNVLIYMYGKAISQAEPINTKEVILEYAEKELGLTAVDGRRLYNILMIPQNAFSRTRPLGFRTHDEVIVAMNSAITELQVMRPKKNKDDIKHLILMFKLRKQYAEYKQIENAYQSADFDLSKAAALRDKLGELLKQTPALNSEFYSLNKNYLNKAEIEEICRVRNEKMQLIYERLQRAAKLK